jgi:hypothetical protein
VLYETSLRIRQNEEQSLSRVPFVFGELYGFRPGAWSGVAWIAGLWGAVPRGRPSGGAGLRKAKPVSCPELVLRRHMRLGFVSRPSCSGSTP